MSKRAATILKKVSKVTDVFLNSPKRSIKIMRNGLMLFTIAFILFAAVRCYIQYNTYLDAHPNYVQELVDKVKTYNLQQLELDLRSYLQRKEQMTVSVNYFYCLLLIPLIPGMLALVHFWDKNISKYFG